MMVSYQEFCRAYKEELDPILDLWSYDMQLKLSKHCIGWHPNQFDFSNYLHRSSLRFYKSYKSLCRDEGSPSICDVGGFWGVYPATLSKLGFKVTMTEALEYYDGCFDGLFDHIQSRKVEVVDIDFFDKNASLGQTYDFVNAMGILEHYPHSLKFFLDNIHRHLSSEGRAFFEVPNIASWHRRIALLYGCSPLPDALTIYESETPFIGHHHEFSGPELTRLLEAAGFHKESTEYFDYSDGESLLKSWHRRSLKFVFPRLRETISTTCRKVTP